MLYKWFGRKVASSQFIPEIDGLRFICIGLVILFHLNLYVAEKSPVTFSSTPEHDFIFWLSSFGHYGVELFFVISGFVLALPFARHYFENTPPVRLRSYFTRRLTRLEPPYILNLLLLMPFAALANHLTFGQILPSFVAGIFYLHNWTFGSGNIINSVVWSLEIEVQFYVLVPWLTRIFSIQRTSLRRGLIIGISVFASLLAGSGWLSGSTLWNYSVFKYIQYFLMGFLLADIYLKDWKKQPSHETRWDIIGLGVALVTLFLWNTENTFLVGVTFPWLALTFYCSAFRGNVINYLFTRPLIVVIGGMCYTLYLFHYAVISAVGRFTVRITLTDNYTVNYLVQFLLLGSAIMIVGSLYYLLIERPCMDRDWPNRLRQRLFPRAVQTPKV